MLNRLGRVCVVRHPKVPVKVIGKQRKNFEKYVPQGDQPGPAEFVFDYGGEVHRQRVNAILSGKPLKGDEGFWRPAYHATAAHCGGCVIGEGKLRTSADTLVGQRHRAGDMSAVGTTKGGVVYTRGIMR